VPAQGGRPAERSSWLKIFLKLLAFFCRVLYNETTIGLGLWLKIDASRGRNDPRKAGKGLPSMGRLRSKSCLGAREGEGPVGGRCREAFQAAWREGVVRGEGPGARLPAGGCGGKDQVS
jgi:hypothetical protein